MDRQHDGQFVSRGGGASDVLMKRVRASGER
jgi:hypothetical protein